MTREPEADGEGIGRRAAMQSVAAMVGLGAAGGASAQEMPTGTPSSTPTPEGDSVVVELGGNVRVTEWEFAEGAFAITFDADLPSAIKVTDTGAVMNSMTSGSGSQAVEIPTRGYSLGSGETTVEFAAEEYDDAYAVTVASSDGAALIRTDSVEAGSTSVKLGTALFGGVTAAGGAGYLSYRETKKSLEEEEEPNAERVL